VIAAGAALAVLVPRRAGAAERLDLGGRWQLRFSDGQRGRPQFAERPQTDPDRYLAAAVPGEVHLDLVRAGLIADPNVGLNVLAARWVEEQIWSYRRTFEAPAAARRGRAWLVFDGLDLAARVVLNGAEVARHANSFYPLRVEVTGKLRAGANVLAVHLDGGLYHVADKPGEGYLHSEDQRLHKRHWLRKPQSQFSWDWAPRLINVGIHGPVGLEWTAEAARVAELVPLASVTPDLARGTLRARLLVEGLGKTAVDGRLDVELVGAGRASAKVTIKPGLQAVEATVTLDRPRLWWPVGQGEPHLYTVRAALTVGGRIVGRREARVGFRHVRVNQEPHPDGGRYFHFEVNGRKVFCRGANLVPADIIVARLDRARYAALVDRALEANFNFLRVWGGGLYESDDFYDLCDDKGILVWQEFVFACGKYPTHDQAFFEDVQREAAHNVRRLARHPSLVAWCGNNENEVAFWHWGHFKKGVVNPDHGFYHLTLPQILAREDGTRYYQPSSPFSPDGLDPNRHDVGDQHPWEVGFANCDFRDYRKMISRFPNEGGVLGPTSLPTMLDCLPEGQRAIGSVAWQVHDNSVDSWQEPSHVDRITSFHLGKDIKKMSVEDYAYWGGLVQGEALREYCDAFRRRMFSTGAAVFWMFNDTWPAVRSWTIVDYHLQRTPAFQPVRRAMAPVSVVVAEDGADIAVFGVNETRAEVEAELRYGVLALAGGFPLDRGAPVRLPPNASTRLAAFPRAALKDPRAQAAFAMLARGGELLARNRLFLPLFKEIRWPRPRLDVTVAAGRATFASPTFVWGVCLDLAGDRPLPDNFFDVWPGIPYTLPWSGEAPRVLRVGNLGAA
jgi:beta-mannosidase